MSLFVELPVKPGNACEACSYKVRRRTRCKTCNLLTCPYCDGIYHCPDCDCPACVARGDNLECQRD